MAFTIPDKGEGLSNIQSILFQEYINILVAGIAGSECVLSGCSIAVGTSGRDIVIYEGKVKSNNTVKSVIQTTVTIAASDLTYPRIDFIYVNSSGAVTLRAGTAAINPKPPIKVSTDVVLAAVYVPANAVDITGPNVVNLSVVKKSRKKVIPISVTSLKPKLAVGEGCANLEYITGATSQPDIPYLAFDADVNQYCGIVIPMPKSWNEGVVTASFQWTRPSGSSAAAVVWGVRAVAVSDADSYNANFGTAGTVTNTASASHTEMNLTGETGNCTVGGTPTENDLVFFEFFRNGTSGADTLTAEAYLTSVKLFYTEDVDTEA